MHYPRKKKVDVYANALRQFTQLEPRRHQLQKYLDFIDGYGNLTELEKQDYKARYPVEDQKMSAFAERYIVKGLEQGVEKGLEQGLEGMERMLARMAALRYPEFQQAILKDY